MPLALARWASASMGFRCTICWIAAACVEKDCCVVGGWRREKKFWVPAVRPAKALLFTGRSMGRKLSRVGTAGTVPCTTCAWRSVLASIGRCPRGTRPRTKSSVEVCVIPPRTWAFVSAACRLEL